MISPVMNSAVNLTNLAQSHHFLINMTPDPGDTIRTIVPSNNHFPDKGKEAPITVQFNGSYRINVINSTPTYADDQLQKRIRTTLHSSDR